MTKTESLLKLKETKLNHASEYDLAIYSVITEFWAINDWCLEHCDEDLSNCESRQSALVHTVQLMYQHFFYDLLLARDINDEINLMVSVVDRF